MTRECMVCGRAFASRYAHRRCGACRHQRCQMLRERLSDEYVAELRARVIARMAERGVDIHGRPLEVTT